VCGVLLDEEAVIRSLKDGDAYLSTIFHLTSNFDFELRIVKLSTVGFDL